MYQCRTGDCLQAGTTLGIAGVSESSWRQCDLLGRQTKLQQQPQCIAGVLPARGPSAGRSWHTHFWLQPSCLQAAARQAGELERGEDNTPTLPASMHLPPDLLEAVLVLALQMSCLPWRCWLPAGLTRASTKGACWSPLQLGSHLSPRPACRSDAGISRAGQRQYQVVLGDLLLHVSRDAVPQ